jgi:hypothetical protein
MLLKLVKLGMLSNDWKLFDFATVPEPCLMSLFDLTRVLLAFFLGFEVFRLP